MNKTKYSSKQLKHDVIHRGSCMSVHVTNELTTSRKALLSILSLFLNKFNKWARSCENCSMAYANNKGADQPA